MRFYDPSLYLSLKCTTCLFQALVFTVMGNDNAEIYFRVDQTGLITVSSLLKDDAKEYTVSSIVHS